MNRVWQIVLYVLALIVFIICSIVTLFYPGAVKLPVDQTGGHVLGFIFGLVGFIVSSFFWFNQEMGIKFLFLFKLKDVSMDDVTGWYLFWERVGAYMVLYVCAFVQFGFI